MTELKVWQEIRDTLESGENLILLLVLESDGSSPGRQGFKMMVGPGERMAGSIGGGIMEHKFVEKARDMLHKGEAQPIIREQIHSKDAPVNQSGMICSGRQRLLLLPLEARHLALFQDLENALEMRNPAVFRLGPEGPVLEKNHHLENAYQFDYQNDAQWLYRERVGLKNTVHIVGGGHVGLATCKVFSDLDFYVRCFDDRPGLNTMAANEWAHECITTPYPELGELIPAGAYEYLVVMTFGYRGDDEAIRALLHKDFAYLGMMGSQAKADELLAGLRRDGFSEERIAQIRTPIGLKIGSRSPAEIAISVAAEVIAVKNGVG